jgi:hypothetical protein
MKLTLKVTVPKGLDWSRIWTDIDSLATGQDASELIRIRTERGIDANGKPFAPYSPRGPVYINPRRGIGLALTPKGGTLSRTGRTMKFADYGEYKLLSNTKTGRVVSAAYSSAGRRPTLIASGRMMISVRPRSHDRTQVQVGVGDEVATYAAGVQQLRPFIGLTAADTEVLVKAMSARIADNLSRAWGSS